MTSEMYPFSKTGGLADVLGALPPALARMGLKVSVITPFYGRMSTAGYELRLVQPDCPVGYPWPPITAEIYQAEYEGVDVFFIGRAEYFDRRFYYNTYDSDYFDNCERFNFFVRAALSWLGQWDEPPSVIHANDWQSALAPAYVQELRKTSPFWKDVKTVMTIHNLAFQGRFDQRLFWESGLPASLWHMDGAEFYGDFNMLKTGIACADAVTTVSPTYAEEILTPAFGCGLEGILNKRRHSLFGIINGADYEIWNPRSDRYIPCCYRSGNLAGKADCKNALIREMFLSDQLEERPILSFIGRLRQQKGIDLLIDILPRLMERDLGVVVLGEGNLIYEAALLEQMEEYQGKLAVRVGYGEDLAHRIHAGSDIFLMPSRYEPCGLTQMYALSFGTPPVATAVGGLRDTITPHPSPNATGFTFSSPTPQAFYEAVDASLTLWEDRDAWNGMARRAMEKAFTWDWSGSKYVELYRHIGVPV